MNDNFYKIDIRNILIVVLILVCIWLFFNPFNNNKIETLEKDNQNKQLQIDSIQRLRNVLKDERLKIDKELLYFKELSDARGDTIALFKKLAKLKDFEIKDLRGDIQLYNEMLKRKREEIDDLILRPIVLPKNIIVVKTKEKMK